jgi:hypothetical protein
MSRAVLRNGLIVVAVLASLVLRPASASANLVRLSTGRVLSVESCQIHGDTAVLVFRDGGSVELPSALIIEIKPDEYLHAPEQRLPESLAPTTTLPVDGLHALVDRLAALHGIDVKLAHAVVQVESNYEPHAVSPKGAKGLMQIMPSVVQAFAVADPFDPEQNLNAGLGYLRELLDTLPDLRLALAAYNAGPGAVSKYGGVPPFPETQEYVQRILALVKRP